jgi:deoxycytidylate deaminase
MRRAFIEDAIQNAEKSSLKIANHGAVVIYRGKVVGNGYNKYCVENVNKVNRWSVHAEVDAINDALRKISRENLKKSILIVVRKMKGNDEINQINKENKSIEIYKKKEKHMDIDINICSEISTKVSEKIGMSAPCKDCASFIRRSGIRTCYFS